MSSSGETTNFIDVEISLERKFFVTALAPKEMEYLVEFRSTNPDEGADIRQLGQASFNRGEFEGFALDPQAYGQALSHSLFQESIKEAFAGARTSANTLGIPLRLRLLIKPEAADLHSLHWETLRDPDDGALLLTTDENLPFSRYLLSKDWRSVHRRPRGELNALVMVANPADLSSYKLDPIKVDDELQRARQSLDSISVTAFPQAGDNRHSTIDTLVDQLRTADYDLLYLVCHGSQVKGEPYLWLEDEKGNAARLSGTDLIARLKELRYLPRLIVLASCQSASDEGAGVLSALGPRLVEIGVPAVVAMQGKVTQDSLAEFMPAFFRSLQRDGEIDRAMAVARGSIRERPDFWMPVLFMRLKDGSMWYEPGFRGKQGERVKFSGWPGLISSIQSGRCTPILGPGLYEWLLGSQREVARRWADTFDYPMAPDERDSLVHVAQFLAVTQRRDFVINELKKQIKYEIMNYHQNDLSPEILQRNPGLSELIDIVGAARRKRDPNEPYSVLARMPFPIYLTVNPGNLLTTALQETDGPNSGKKDPQIVLCPWNDFTEAAFARSTFGKEKDFSPDPARPLIYHFFGRLDQEDSLVLTEDDYFDFLLGINKKLIPKCLNSALANNSLLFLGFQMEDWNFRTLLRYVLSLAGGVLQRKHIHVAVQINPEESGFLKPAGAYSYLDTYFTYEANIEVFWGSTEDFIKELQEQYKLWAA